MQRSKLKVTSILCRMACCLMSQASYDYSKETVYFESTPSLGDLAVNVVLGATLLWLPLTFAAIGRVAFVKYRYAFTTPIAAFAPSFYAACCAATACLRICRCCACAACLSAYAACLSVYAACLCIPQLP